MTISGILGSVPKMSSGFEKSDSFVLTIMFKSVSKYPPLCITESQRKKTHTHTHHRGQDSPRV